MGGQASKGTACSKIHGEIFVKVGLRGANGVWKLLTCEFPAKHNFIIRVHAVPCMRGMVTHVESVLVKAVSVSRIHS
jgi:hypothetical protein